MKLRTQLENINKAIQQIETGAQEYSIGSRKLRRGDLNVLYTERSKLEEKLASVENPSSYTAIFDGR